MKNIKEEIEEVEFFDLMQAYRIADPTDQDRVSKKFQDVKDWIIKRIESLESESLEQKIEKIPEGNFYGSGIVEPELEAYGDETYIISLPLEIMRDEYYGADCIENIRENDDWIEDRAWIREYFLNHLSDIEIYGK